MRVLTAWLPPLDHHIRLADLVLFSYVRAGAFFAPRLVNFLQGWIAKYIDIAAGTRDKSLVESLIYTLGASYSQHLRAALLPYCSLDTIATACTRADLGAWAESAK